MILWEINTRSGTSSKTAKKKKLCLLHTPYYIIKMHVNYTGNVDSHEATLQLEKSIILSEVCKK